MKLDLTKPYLETENVCYMVNQLMWIISNNIEDLDGLFGPNEEEWLGAISIFIATIEAQ